MNILGAKKKDKKKCTNDASLKVTSIKKNAPQLYNLNINKLYTFLSISLKTDDERELHSLHPHEIVIPKFKLNSNLEFTFQHLWFNFWKISCFVTTVRAIFYSMLPLF